MIPSFPPGFIKSVVLMILGAILLLSPPIAALMRELVLNGLALIK